MRNCQNNIGRKRYEQEKKNEENFIFWQEAQRKLNFIRGEGYERKSSGSSSVTNKKEMQREIQFHWNGWQIGKQQEICELCPDRRN